jgi:hypothetical protein
MGMQALRVMSICWIVYVFACLTQTSAALNSQPKEEAYLAKLPVLMSLQRLKTGKIVLELVNLTSKEQKLRSNLAPVLDLQFLKFPMFGCFQFRNERGKQIQLFGQGSNGWWQPGGFSSYLDLEKSQKTRRMDGIVIHGSDVQRYPIYCEGVLRFAGRICPKDEFIKQFRVRLPFEISTKAGPKLRVTVTSEWFSFPENIVQKGTKAGQAE